MDALFIGLGTMERRRAAGFPPASWRPGGLGSEPPVNTPKAPLVEARDRAQAAMLGVAIGDALGATVEFMTPKEIRTKHGTLREIKGGGWLGLPAGHVTDDTEMTLCIARAIDACGWSLREIADGFAGWLRTRPVDVGNTCRRGIRRYMHDGSLAGPPNDGDAGNGAAMRMAPVALATLGDTALLEEWAIQQAHITHHHPLSDAACVLVGRLLHLACTGWSRSRLRAEADETIARFPNMRFAPYHGLATTYVVDTLQTVLHFFFTTNSFEDCLVATVNQGGDADTTGAIVGALAGAFYGLGGIPGRWIKRLDPTVVKEIDYLSGRLFDRSPLAAGAQSPSGSGVLL